MGNVVVVVGCDVINSVLFGLERVSWPEMWAATAGTEACGASSLIG